MSSKIFILSILIIIYAYFGYPCSLFIVNFIKEKKVKRHDLTIFFITFIITVHNEEKRIVNKLENTLALEYPSDKFQIIIASDGSNDRTNQIIKDYEEYGIELLSIPERRGKEFAQKKAVNNAKGDVFIFSDVATKLPKESLMQIVSNFSDPTVGAVSGEDRLIGKNGQETGESLYVKYEMWLRRLESDVHSLVGLSGSFFAARKEVCEDFSEEMQSDFRTVLNCIKLGYRAISDPKSIGYYEDVSNSTREFERKVRTVLRGLTVFFRNTEFLNFMKYGFFSYQYFCHKLLRWLVPFLLFIAFGSNLILASESFLYFFLLLCQITFYGFGIAGFIRKDGTISKFVKIPMYFTVVNLAIINAWWKFIKGERIVLWTPSKR